MSHNGPGHGGADLAAGFPAGHCPDGQPETVTYSHPATETVRDDEGRSTDMYPMKQHILICAIAAALLAPSLAGAAITSVTLTPAPPTTLSDGRSYYTAGVTRTFRIQATDPLATGKGDWTSILVAFREGGVTRESFTVTIGPDTAVGTGVEVDSVTDNTGGGYTNIDYTVVLRFRWGCTPITSASNVVRATVTNVNGSLFSDRTFLYGVVSQFRILNLAQSGDAADGRVNPWHDLFNLTGRVVYHIAGQAFTNAVPAAEITAVDLYRIKTNAPADTTDTTIGNGAALPDVQFTIAANYFSTLYATDAIRLDDYNWNVRLTMNTPIEPPGAYPLASSNSLPINCNKIQIESLTFENGGGVNNPPDPYYVRSVNVAGTRIRLRASRESGSGAMVGATNFAISDGTNTYTLLINNAAFEGTVLVNPVPAVAPGGNVQVGYTVTRVYGGAYGNTNPANGQNAPGRIVNSGPHNCRWENNHPPGNQAGIFTGDTLPITVTTTAVSFTLNWTSLTTAAPNYDADFDTYRVYFKRQADITWVMLDQSTNASLGTITTNSFTVGGLGQELEPLTDYDYRISALDVFGNEVAPGNQITDSVTTNAELVTASITDGITIYNNDHFNDTNPSSRPLRRTAIKVTVKIFTAGSLPNAVNIIVANNDSDLGLGAPQWGLDAAGIPGGAFDDILTLVEGVSYWRIPCSKMGPNTYEGFIPSEHPLMNLGTNIRFIVETVKGGASSYTDHTPEIPPAPGDYWSDEWRFRVETRTLFIPWPTRVLNNVLTARMPCAFPAYFLVADALVTIKVHDVKGRVIATLADKTFRPGGQNVKDMGWCGRNKDNRRAGPGLYYLHIKATTYGGKTILDKIMKVVVAH